MYVEKSSRKRESEKPRERVVSLQLFLPPGHPIIYCEIKLFKMATVSVKRSIGAASHKADMGFSDAQIRTLGRWKSDAFRIYIRSERLHAN